MTAVDAGDGRRARRGGEVRLTQGSPLRLVSGLLALGALALLLSQAGRLPGAAGDAIRGNADADRHPAALFYTDVDGWPAWSMVDSPERPTEFAVPHPVIARTVMLSRRAGGHSRARPRPHPVIACIGTDHPRPAEPP